MRPIYEALSVVAANFWWQMVWKDDTAVDTITMNSQNTSYQCQAYCSTAQGLDTLTESLEASGQGIEMDGACCDGDLSHALHTVWLMRNTLQVCILSANMPFPSPVAGEFAEGEWAGQVRSPGTLILFKSLQEFLCQAALRKMSLDTMSRYVGHSSRVCLW